MFFTTLEVDNFNCTKMNTHFKKKSQHVYWGGGGGAKAHHTIMKAKTPV